MKNGRVYFFIEVLHMGEGEKISQPAQVFSNIRALTGMASHTGAPSGRRTLTLDKSIINTEYVRACNHSRYLHRECTLDKIFINMVNAGNYLTINHTL